MHIQTPTRSPIDDALQRCRPDEVVLVVYWPDIDRSLLITIAREAYPALLEKYAAIMKRHQQQCIVEVFSPTSALN